MIFSIKIVLKSPVLILILIFGQKIINTYLYTQPNTIFHVIFTNTNDYNNINTFPFLNEIIEIFSLIYIYHQVIGKIFIDSSKIINTV